MTDPNADPNADPSDDLAAAQAAVERCRQAGDRPGLANALIVLSAYLQNAGRLGEAVVAAEEGVGVFRGLGGGGQLAWGLENLASRFAAAGRFGEAVRAALERAEIYRRIADRLGLANALILLSAYLQNAGRFPEAVAAAQEGVGIYREFGNESQLAWGLENLNARYAAAPGLRVMRAVLSATNGELLSSLIRELSLDVVGGLQEDEQSGLARAEAYVSGERVDVLRSRGITVAITDDATATGLARQSEVGRGNRYADGAVPAGLGILIQGDGQ